MRAFLRPRRLIHWRSGLGLAVLGALLVGASWWRASWIANRLLGSWAATTISEKSAGVYGLAVGRVRFNVLLRRVSVDSIALTTNRTVNAARQRPLAGLRLGFRQCTISGVHVIALVFNGGLIAGSFGCEVVSVAVVVPRGTYDPTAPAPGPRRAFLVLQQSLPLPSFAPRVRIAHIDLPQLVLDFRLQRRAAGDSRLQLERLQWRMSDFSIDPTDSMAATHPLFSRTVELAAANFVAHPDSGFAVRVGSLLASLTDSTLEVRDVTLASTLTDAAFARSGPYRRDLIKTAVGRITAAGVDVGAFVLGQGVRARRLELDSLRLDVTSDQRRRSNPKVDHHRTPQGWIADFDRAVSVDSVVVRQGEVVYRERHAGRGEAGVLTFARLELVALNLSHVVGRQTRGDAMTLRATAHLQNLGRLDTRFVVPLDAPGFDMTLAGTLGPMPAVVLNPFVREIVPLRIATGRIGGITFNMTVANGVARGTITPRYDDLSVAVTRSGSEGILGSSGLFGGAARGVVSFMGNWMKVRANNPDFGQTTPRSGTIDHAFTPKETLPGFLWASLRDGLLPVVQK